MPESDVTQRSAKAGLAPGTMVYVGKKASGPPRISLIDYTESDYSEREGTSLRGLVPFTDQPTVTWLNVEGVNDTQTIQTIGEYLELHPLLLEDLVNTQQRPKLEDYGDYLFIVLKMLRYDETTGAVQVEQVSLVLGQHYLVSFQEGDQGDVFDQVRARIHNGIGRLRKAGADYLAYALMDAIVDGYFVILEKIGDEIEELEDALITDPTPETLQEIHRLKREMIALRHSVWPLREVIGFLEREESPLIEASTDIYLRDVYDHTIQVIDGIETLRDVLAGMLDIYLSGVSNRMNEVMKVLTIFASIFIPLTFLVGVYGMNFQHMPELALPWAYPALWVLMIAVSGVLLLYFKRKGWL